MPRSGESVFTPAWWIPGAHLQTLWGKLVRRPPVVLTRVERWSTPDGDELEIRRLDSSDDAPRLLILHGLEGTIRSHYLRGLLDQARRAGWAADVLLFRGCNGEVGRAPRLYHSGETTDLDFVVQRLVSDRPSQPLVIAGFSLGGNVLLKWLGEQGRSAPVQVVAAAAVSVPFDLESGSRHIENGFSRVYTRHFLRTLRDKALAKLDQYPDLFDRARLDRARNLYEFDDAVTAPVHGFLSATDYYSRSSSRHFLSAIARPTLLLSALDDPFLPREVADDVAMVAASNPCLSVEFSERGGHVGFVAGSVPWRPHYFAEERVTEFLSAQLTDSAFSTSTNRP